MNERIAGLLGMARRAGRLIAGFDAVKEAALAGKAQLVLTAADLSPKTAKELCFALPATVQPLTVGLTKDEIGHAAGWNKPVGVVATEDAGFAAALRRAACHNEEDNI